jgi:protease IV
MRKFFRDTFVSALGSLIGLGLLGFVGFITFIGLLIAIFAGEKTGEIKDKSVLVFDLSATIRDQRSGVTIEDALIGNLPNSLSLRQVKDAIENAATDERISGIFLQGDGYGNYSGFATLKEVRKSLEKFKESGKPIIAYDVDLLEGEYYLSSIADKFVLNPMGLMEMNGLGVSQMFLTGALEKYGIGMQIIRVGNYKSAIEPLTRKDFSPENRQQTQELLNDLWGDFTQTVGNSRQINPQTIQQLVNNKGIILPQEALSNGFVDEIGYYDQVLTHLRELTGAQNDEEDFASQIYLDEYITLTDSTQQGIVSDNQIAVIYAEGEIVDGFGDINTIGGDSLAETLRQVRDDDTVKAVVLRINSPGGSATASEIIWREVSLLSQKLPVTISMGDLAASGGYWIAMGGNYIFAETTTITGSIGVFGILPNIQQLGENNGITWDVVKTGNFADIDTLSRPKTERELQIAQSAVNEIYSLFLDRVAVSRNLTKEKVSQIAQGRVWSGIDGKNIGLVDEIGGLNEAIAYAVEKANVGDDWSLQEYPIPKTLEEEILQQLFPTQGKNNLDPLTKEWLKIKEDLAILKRLNDPRGVYAILPHNFRVK